MDPPQEFDAKFETLQISCENDGATTGERRRFDLDVSAQPGLPKHQEPRCFTLSGVEWQKLEYLTLDTVESMFERLKRVTESQIEKILKKHHEELLADMLQVVENGGRKQELPEANVPKDIMRLTKDLTQSNATRILEPENLAWAWEEPITCELDNLNDEGAPEVNEHAICASVPHFAPNSHLYGQVPESTLVDNEEMSEQEVAQLNLTHLVENATRSAHKSTHLDDAQLHDMYSNLMMRYDSMDNATIQAARRSLNKRRLHCIAAVQVKDSWTFHVIVNGAILVNFVLIAVERDLEIRRVQSVARGDAVHTESPNWFLIADLIFVVLFTTELLIRLLAEEGKFCVGEFGAWNIFDACLVTVSIIELVMNELYLNASFARLMRLFRICRAFKVMRIIRGLTELRLMIQSICAIVPTLFWSMLLMILIMLLVALITVSAVADFIDDHPNVDMDPYAEYFSSVPMTLLTLFMCVLDGVSWWVVVDPVLDISLMYGMLIVLFVYAIKLGILNIITSIFLQNANSFAQNDLDLSSAVHAQRNAFLLKRLVHFFDTLDEDGSGSLSVQEFSRISDLPAARVFFEEFIGINVEKVKNLFNLLDQGCDGVINREEFVVGCMQVKGGNKNHDAQMQLGISKGIARDILKIKATMGEIAQALSKRSSKSRSTEGQEVAGP